MNKNIFKSDKQVDAKHYNFTSYVDRGRWLSFYEQIMQFYKLSPDASVLEIGAGLSINRKHVEEYLPKMTYKTLDIADDLYSDYKGSVINMPLPDKSFDAIFAFEILEHLPFEQFEVALLEMKRVSKEVVVISLPHFGPPISFLMKLPFLPEIKFSVKIPYYKKHEFNGQHYWEIGKKGYSVGMIKSVIVKHFKIVDEFVPFENQYHHFFVLKIK